MTNDIFQDFHPLAAIATTPTAAQTLQPLCQIAGATLWCPESLHFPERDDVPIESFDRGSLKSHIASLWQTHRAFIFGLATGAVVRLIAPLLQDKSSDPAVIVVDQTGQFVISLCSGHQGKADQLARLIALQLGATPILTGGSTGLNLPAIDMLGIPLGWQRGEGDWTGVSAAIAKGERVEVIQEVGSRLWQEHLPPGHPFVFETEEETVDANSVNSSPINARIWISFTQRRFSPTSDLPKVQWHPRVLWVGIGCERGTSRELIETAITQTCQRYHLAMSAIAGIATIDIKANEVGLVEFCQAHDLPLQTFPAEVLRSVNVPTPSTVVNQAVGTPSVAEAAALVCSERFSASGTKVPTTNSDRAHVGAPLRVSKQIVRADDQPGAVTVAIAVAQREYIGKTGQLLLVGIGPGELDQITPAAKTALSDADAIIGYSLYIDLISPILHPGQIVESLPITQERQRAQRAIELAQWGLTVAVVSSGDCGIYGMAGLVLEELKAQGWDGKTPKVQVFPGITALQAAASRVGAPLMHDFCAISLSNLLTPWQVIEKRLNAAAQADFVIALYNPRSRTRIEQLTIAHRIILQYRSPQTPIAIVRSAYREDENITLTTLDKLLDSSVDMLTTVLIGNQSTCLHQDWMITPRGYLMNEQM